MQINALRGLLYEFGATFARGRNALFSEIEATLESLANSMPQYVADSLREQVQRIKQLGADIKAVEVRLTAVLRTDTDMRRVAQIPGRGSADGHRGDRHDGTGQGIQVGARVLRLAGPGAQTARHGRAGQSAGHLQTGRHLLAHLAHPRRALGAHAYREPGPWLQEQLKGRRPANVVIVAQAAKMARTILGRDGPAAGLPTWGYQSIGRQAA